MVFGTETERVSRTKQACQLHVYCNYALPLEQVTAHQVKQTHMERYNNYKQLTSDSTSSETNTHGALQ